MKISETPEWKLWEQVLRLAKIDYIALSANRHDPKKFPIRGKFLNDIEADVVSAICWIDEHPSFHGLCSDLLKVDPRQIAELTKSLAEEFISKYPDGCEYTIRDARNFERKSMGRRRKGIH